ncbi:penicillin-binding transpeptidase domain-containing protein [Clostridium luticellarii]|uniref:penicillin-binding transpeptidase domain-containing protein n=1 Tax=Clostridium luticellarii TaxID=1691940 RepID=UPI0023530353|nr:penicillin-binding transpeptidase domain-containing protein [Clostridium luticellarii]MCI1996986.1 penicillin-binding transpeptidase domain-containing protein [Clostridium luticellarii]
MRRKFLLAICMLLFLIVVGGCSRNEAVEKSSSDYIKAWVQKDYKLMYSQVSSDSKSEISEKNFVNRYENIYSGMELKKISIKIDTDKDIEYKDGKAQVPVKVDMYTPAGEIKFSNTINLEKENKEWKIAWDSKAIFPQLDKNDKVRVEVKRGKRGTIYDRNGNALAEDGNAAQVGIIPGEFNKNGENTKAQIAALLNISKEDIDKKLSESYVKQDMFIPIKIIPEDDDRLNFLEQGLGISVRDVEERVYPLKDAAAHLTGYVRKVTAEDLKSDESYSADDVIGQYGLEKIYDSILRARDGYDIYIVDGNEKRKSTIIKKNVENGSNIRVTIDSKIQTLLYDELKQDAGTGVSMNPKTGEVLSLVSTPSFDPNDFVMGMSNDKWKSLNEDKRRVFYNRFQGIQVPGSIFKPITAAISLKLGTLNPEESKNISGLKWRKDSSWGGYYITRVEDYGQPSNLLNALVYSDNIYFAQTALDVGKDNMENQLKDFGIGESMPFEYGLSKSQISVNNKIASQIQLADSGYGQGQILLNPVHLMAIYDSFVNAGNIVKPYLLYKDHPKAEIWKKDVYSKEIADTILKDLVQVVQNPHGTGHGAYIPGMNLAGKTGTAEIKASQQDGTGTELGWFAAVNVDNPNLLVVAMVENAKDKGGSHYVVPMVKNVFQQVNLNN